MPVPGLTNKRVLSAKPKHRTYFIRDDKQKGLGLKVAKSGRKTYVVNATRKGVRHIETIGVADDLSLKEARNLAGLRINEFTALRNPRPDAPFEVVAELVLRRMERLWKPSTIVSNRCHLRKRIMPLFRGRPIAEINRSDIEDWFAGQRATPGGANRAAPVLSVILREAEAMGLRPEGSNPVEGLRRYRRPKMERVLTGDEMARLGAGLERRRGKAPMQTAFIELLVLTGCRMGEIRDLQWQDYRDGNLHLRESKTGPKTIFLCSGARSVLEGVNSKRPGPVFPAKLKSRGGMKIDHFWNSLRREIGIEDVRLHDLRHTYASVAVRMGENLNTIGSLLGHRKPDTTMRYTHLDDGMMRDAAEQVGGVLAPKGKGERT